VAEWFMFAERYHWTPEQVDALPLGFADHLPALINAYAAAQDHQQRRANTRTPAADALASGRRIPGSMAVM
jgi:hypothetical protein